MQKNYGVRYRVNSSKKKMLIALVVIALLLAIMSVLFLNGGNYLVVEDDLVYKADIIVLLMGSLPDRTLHAVDLYQAGKGNKILLISEHMTGIEDVRKRGANLASNAEIAKQLAIDLGVPESALLLLDGDTMSTQDEAIRVRELLDETKNVGSIVLVTSKYHSYRAKLIFERALADDIAIFSSPSSYDTYNGAQWWKSRTDTRNLIFEILKLCNYHLREKYQL